MEPMEFCSTTFRLLISFTLLLKFSIVTGTDYRMNQQGPVFILEPPKEVIFLNNRGAVIDCLAHGYPDPVIKWITNDGMEVYEVDGLLKLPKNGSLVFKPFDSDSYDQPIHAQIYRCAISNNQGRLISKKVKVRAVVVQMYETQVYNSFVIAGNVGVLKCHIPSYVKDHVTVTAWIREDKKIVKTKRDDMYISQPSGSLYIRDVTKKDDNLKYWCQTKHLLTNEAKLSVAAGRIVVSEPEGTVPPRITDREPNVEVNVGENVDLSCAGQGHPPPRYNWFYKGDDGKTKVLNLDDQYQVLGERLRIDNVQLNQSGVYLCVVTNSAGKQQTETILSVKSPLTVYITPQVSKADSGTSTNFTCSISGGPVNSILWLWNGYPVEENVKQRIPDVVISDDTRHLRIDRVDKENEGMYQCVVENDWESAQGASQLILGASRPEVVRGFQSQVLDQKMRLFLECLIEGIPIPDIRWYVDGRKIVRSRHRVSIKVVRVKNNNLLGQLIVEEISRDVGGDYSCEAVNKAGTSWHTARIDVRGLPSIRQFNNMTVVAGTTIKIKCFVLGYPIHRVIWKRDGDIPLLSDRYTVSDRELTISNVDKASDSGRFTCKAINIKGHTAKSDIWIKVIEKPVLDDMVDKDVEQEISLKLMCSAIRGDPPITFRWKFNGRPLPDNLGLMVTKHSDLSLLMIPSVGIVHQGNYTCLALNNAGNSTKTITVTVKAPPTWKRVPINPILLFGPQTKLDCEANGHPPPSISWYQLSQDDVQQDLVNDTSHLIMQNGTIIIAARQSRELLSSRYKCVVRNDLGKLSHVFRLEKGLLPEIHAEEDEIVSHFGDTVTIRCKVTSGTEPMSIRWTVNNRNIHHNNNKYRLSNTKHNDGIISTLIVRNYAEKDNGQYKCLVTNQVGSRIKVITLTTLDVVGPEHVTLKKNQDDNLMTMILPITAISTVVLLSIVIAIVCVRIRKQQTSHSPLYGFPPIGTTDEKKTSSDDRSTVRRTDIENKLDMDELADLRLTAPISINPVIDSSYVPEYQVPEYQVPEYYADISPYATFQLPQSPRPILTTFSSGKDTQQSTFV
ncbi:Dscam (predicted) [Pycnogonum litorale]